MFVAALCTGVLALLVFVLGFGVSINRIGEATGKSKDSGESLHKWVRAHGNATEYVPILAILFLFLGSRDPASWVVWCIVGATLARLIHPIGMVLSKDLSGPRPHPLRFLGAGGTYFAGFVLCVATLLEAAQIGQ